MAIVTQLRKHLRAAWTWIAVPTHLHGCQTCASTWECQDTACQHPTVVPVCEDCEIEAAKAQARESAKKMRAQLRLAVARRRAS